MRLALVEACAADLAGEVPVGCVIVHEDRVISRGHNLRERSQDPTAHAELIAIKGAASRLGTWRLSGATAFVTLEPCPMCAGALVNARVDRVVYGARDPKAGATETLYTIGSDLRLNHRFAIRSGVLADECGALLSAFFQRIREGRRARRD
ncbi:MAG: nucleoside deaminase [Sandaracinaceae bacterium]|nr:nucleoside deaminase [Sandaracinaceae bacterium]